MPCISVFVSINYHLYSLIQHLKSQRIHPDSIKPFGFCVRSSAVSIKLNLCCKKFSSHRRKEKTSPFNFFKIKKKEIEKEREGSSLPDFCCVVGLKQLLLNRRWLQALLVELRLQLPWRYTASLELPQFVY